jgi:hypothetical protein
MQGHALSYQKTARKRNQLNKLTDNEIEAAVSERYVEWRVIVTGVDMLVMQGNEVTESCGRTQA